VTYDKQSNERRIEVES